MQEALYFFDENTKVSIGIIKKYLKIQLCLKQTL